MLDIDYKTNSWSNIKRKWFPWKTTYFFHFFKRNWNQMTLVHHIKKIFLLDYMLKISSWCYSNAKALNLEKQTGKIVFLWYELSSIVWGQSTVRSLAIQKLTGFFFRCSDVSIDKKVPSFCLSYLIDDHSFQVVVDRLTNQKACLIGTLNKQKCSSW